MPEGFLIGLIAGVWAGGFMVWIWHIDKELHPEDHKQEVRK